jgi:hypothetical protein
LKTTYGSWINMLFALFLASVFVGLGLLVLLGKAFGLPWLFVADAALFLLALYVKRRAPMAVDSGDWLFGPMLPPPGTRPLPPPGTRALTPTVRSGTGRKALPPR